ncbi:hypothetical protein B0H11DRAFT_1909778 [Mycena galericulata]|nr:hypothetical protein B0H11DRAFT_1909778 [Mycena galericulata]
MAPHLALCLCARFISAGLGAVLPPLWNGTLHFLSFAASSGRLPHPTLHYGQQQFGSLSTLFPPMPTSAQSSCAGDSSPSAFGRSPWPASLQASIGVRQQPVCRVTKESNADMGIRTLYLRFSRNPYEDGRRRPISGLNPHLRLSHQRYFPYAELTFKILASRSDRNSKSTKVQC